MARRRGAKRRDGCDFKLGWSTCLTACFGGGCPRMQGKNIFSIHGGLELCIRITSM